MNCAFPVAFCNKMVYFDCVLFYFQPMPLAQTLSLSIVCGSAVWALPHVWYWLELLPAAPIRLFDSQLSLSIKTVPLQSPTSCEIKGREGRRENMLGLHLNPNKRRLTLAPSGHVYTNEQATDRVSGDPLVWVCPMKPLTSLRGRDRVEC